MKRVLTALIAIPIVLLITIYSPDWFFASAVGVVAALGVEEFLELASKKGIGRPGRWFLVPAAIVSFSFTGGPPWVIAAFVLATLTLMTATIFGGQMETAFGRVGMGVSGIGYCSLTLGFLILMPRDLILP